MKIHTVFITHNRLELTKQTIESYLETVTVPWTATVVDNASSDGTPEEIARMCDVWGADLNVVGFDENRYPGAACNWGWGIALPDTSHLHRSDNDFRFLPGWCEEVERQFRNPKIGQVGLRTDEEDGKTKYWEPGNTGGNCVILRELFDAGLRYDERPWPQIRAEVGDGYSEDSFFSSQVVAMGYRWTRVKRPCIQNLATGDWGDDYYRTSYGVRGIKPHPDDPTLPEGFVPYGE